MVVEVRTACGLPLLRWGEERIEAESTYRTDYLKVSSRRAGMIDARSGQLSQRQGFVFISMRKGVSSLSIMKSMPNSSKLCSRRCGSRCRQVALTASRARLRILGRICSLNTLPLTSRPSSLNLALSRYSPKAWQLILLPRSYLPQSSAFFWTASLVRCTKGPDCLLRENLEEAVRTYPSGNQQARKMPLRQVRSMQWRRSNFRPRQRRGRSMYFCRMNVRRLPSLLLSLPFTRCFISSREKHTLMPLPRLLFSPGLMIQMFLTSSPFRLRSSSSWQVLRKALQLGSLVPVTMWKVRGRAWARGCPVSSQQLRMKQKSAFLLPMQKLLGRWLCISRWEDPSMIDICLHLQKFTRCLYVRSLRVYQNLLFFAICYCQFARSMELKILLWTSGASFTHSSCRWKVKILQGSVFEAVWWGYLKREFTFSCVHTNWQFSMRSVTFHQQRRLRIERIRLQLFPGPMQALYVCSFSGTLTQRPLAQFTFQRKS